MQGGATKMSAEVNAQFAGVSKFHSHMLCLIQLLEHLFDLKNALDEGESVDALYLDCCKAFHTVSHKHLIAKLQGMGIDGHNLQWVLNSLTGR